MSEPLAATHDAPPCEDGMVGITVPAVTEWLVEHVGLEPPLAFALISGGRSNLTYSVDDARGERYVLRRPPVGHVLATAHDMGREHRILSALAPTDVPVAPVVGFCEDPSVNGAPFYVMRHVDGSVLAGLDDALQYPVDDRRTVSFTMIDVLGRIHAVDPDRVGLGTLGKRAGYLQRQLARWHTQYEQSKRDELPALDEVYDRLVRAVPPQRWTGLVHGDYRLGNMMLGSGGTIEAVLDWELSTLGDVLADVAWLVNSWVEPGEVTNGPFTAPTSAPGFATRREIVAAYERTTGRDLSDLPYYIAFSNWRSACIGTGVLNRYRSDAMGTVDFDVEQHARSIQVTAERALAALDGNIL